MPSSGERPPGPPERNRLRFELLFGLALVLAGLVLLPPLIYMVGTLLLGPYTGGGHLGSFYGDLFRDLGQGSPQAWLLVLGPLVLVEAGRLILLDFRIRADADEPTAPARETPARSGQQTRERREPTLRL